MTPPPTFMDTAITEEPSQVTLSPVERPAPPDVNRMTAIEKQIDEVLIHMRRLDRRDRWRMIGGIIHGCISLIYPVLIIASAWYAYTHGSEIIQGVMEKMRNAIPGANQDFFKSFSDFFKR